MTTPAPPAPQGQGQPPAPAPPGPVAVAGAGIMHDGPGVLLALLAYPLAVNLLRGGPAQMWAWVRAKFVNQTTAAGSGAQQNTPPSQGSPGTQPGAGAQKNNANPLNPRTPPTPTTTRTRQ